MTMKLYAGIAIVALALVAAGCGSGEAQTAGPVPSSETETTTSEEQASGSYRVWLTRGEHLFAAWREGPLGKEPAGVVLPLLLQGPSAEEVAAGVGTAIPAGTRYLKVTIGEDGTATVDVSSEYESGGGSASMFARLAQVVYTLTELPHVKRVSFELDGKPVDVFSGEGIVLEKPVTRADYEDQLPPILVTSNVFGAKVSSPVRVSGNANVFEANVTGRILDENGKELVSRFTTATCGTGCRGDFTMELPYQVAVDQPGTLVLQDDDADGDGKPGFEVRIPIMLSQG
jgi:sporulation and spore germination protein/immunoglobulin-like protein involved in spore germination